MGAHGRHWKGLGLELTPQASRAMPRRGRMVGATLGGMQSGWRGGAQRTLSCVGVDGASLPAASAAALRVLSPKTRPTRARESGEA